MTIDEVKKKIGNYTLYEPYHGCSEQERKVGIVIGIDSPYALVRFLNETDVQQIFPRDLIV